MMSSMKSNWPQWLAGIAVTLLLIQIGFMGAWTSPYLPKLTAEDSPLPLTIDESSWVASIMNFSRIFGGIAGAVGSQKLGTKMTNLLSVVAASVCWTLTAIANSASWLYVARFSSGLSLGMGFACFPLYLGEISDPKIRGALVAMAITGTPIGNCLVNLIGSMFTVVESSIAFLISSILLIFFFMWLPESPHHLIRKLNIQKTRDSIAWYHRGCDVDAEYASLEKFVFTSKALTVCESLGEFQRPAIQRASFIIIALYMFQQVCSLNIVFYMVMIITQAKVTIIDPSDCATIVMSFGIVSAIVSINLMDRLGRRVLLICSTSILVLSFIALEVYFTLLESNYDTKLLQWIPITALIFAEFAIFLGLMPVPSTILSELFPSNIKCIASCGASISAATFGFLSVKTYQPLLDLMGQRYVYWIYIAISLLAIPFALFVMPETRGKSLQQIQDDMMITKSTNDLNFKRYDDQSRQSKNKI